MLEYTFDDIENYLNGTIENREAFELAMTLNPELKQKVQVTELANNLIIENRLLAVEELVKNQANKPAFSVKKWLTGLGLLSLIGATLFFLSVDKEIKPAQQTNQNPVKQDIKIEEKKSSDINPSPEENQNKKKETSVKVESKLPETNIIHENKDFQVISPTKTDTVKQEVGKFEKQINLKPAEPKIDLPVDPCKNAAITISTTIKESCYGQENGYLQIVSIEGGTEPYQKTLQNSVNEDVSNYTQLASGKYKLSITDKNGCKKTQSFVVENRFCEIDDSFNPSLGETWNIPSFTEIGILTIRNSAGNIVFEKEIPASETLIWDGKNKNGEIETGYLLFFIQYKSGSKQKGSVTLVR